jgi:dipeptidyl aminopeptidase/acylaminoacyl peptidase
MLDWLQASVIRTNNQTWATRMYGSKTVYDVADSYLRLSVVYRAAEIHTPTLLAVGDGDQVEVVLPAISMYNSLRFLGRDVTLLRYPGQGHVFHGTAMRDLWDREINFFDTHLRD